MDEQFGVIYRTKEYDKFKTIKGNRKLNVRNYIKLLKSMEEELLVVPILVNSNFEIIDGQHRYTSCKELNKYVYYYIVEGYGIDQVRRSNLVSSNWTKSDYLNMHLEEDNDEYISFNVILKETNMNISDLLKLYAMVQHKSGVQISYEFEAGSFSAEGTSEVREFLNTLENFNFFKLYKSQSFVAAFIKLYTNTSYNNQRLIEKTKLRKNSLEQLTGGTIDEYLSCICNKIYSFGPGKDNIFYDINTKRFYN